MAILVLVLVAVAASILLVNYALYTAAIAASLLIAVDLPHPSTLGDVGLRVLFTHVGGGIAVAVTLPANLIQKPTARTTFGTKRTSFGVTRPSPVG